MELGLAIKNRPTLQVAGRKRFQSENKPKSLKSEKTIKTNSIKMYVF